MTVQIFSWQNSQGVANRNLLNLRNLRLNLFRHLGLIQKPALESTNTMTAAARQ